MKNATILIALFILAVVLLTGCGISKDSYIAAVEEANELRVQLFDLQADLANAQTDLDKSNSDLATAQQNLNIVLDDRDTILEQLDETEDDLITTKDQLKSAKSMVATLQSQVTSLQSQIATLQGQVDQFQAIIDLSQYSIKLDTLTVSLDANTHTTIVSFTADYAGYIVVSGTSSIIEGYIRVEDSFPDYPYNSYSHYFGLGSTLKIPVLPGTIIVRFINQDTVWATATITVTYYY
jgi:flagellar biosynthesis chaperone FliJ